MENEITKKLSTGVELKYSESRGLRVANTGYAPYGSLQMNGDGDTFYMSMSGCEVDITNLQEYKERIAILEQSMIEANEYLKEVKSEHEPA